MVRLADRIAAANADAMDRLARAAPVWRGVREAWTLIPALTGRSLLHSGPPIPPRARRPRLPRALRRRARSGGRPECARRRDLRSLPPRQAGRARSYRAITCNIPRATQQT